MCVVSMVYDHGAKHPEDYWNKETLNQFQRALNAAKVVDELTDQPDCEDPKKAEFFKRVELRVAAREAATRVGCTGQEACEAFILGAEWASSR